MERHARITAGRLAEAFGKTLVLLPHHDDECAAGALLHELGPRAMALFLTDSAPADAYFWKRFGSRERYRALRQEESLATLGELGVEVRFGPESACDQQLYSTLPEALEVTLATALAWRPRTVLAPAYEGGHPDHDCASFLAAAVSKAVSAHHWELPYYHLTRSGKYRRQQFLEHPTKPVEWHLALSEEELVRKRAMWSRYESQCEVLTAFDAEREQYRRAPAYGFSKAPHGGLLNYEAWEWPVRSADVLRAFAHVQESAAAA